MNALVKHWEMAKMRWVLWWALFCLRSAVRKVLAMPEDEAAFILTKWRWDASRAHGDMRDTLLKLVAAVERRRKELYEPKN